MTDGTTQSQGNNDMQTEYVTFLSHFEINRQLYPKENIFLLVVPKRSRFMAELQLL